MLTPKVPTQVGSDATVIKLAAFKSISFFLSQTSAGFKSERIGDYSYTRETAAPADNINSGGLPSEAQALLKPFQRPVFRTAMLPTDRRFRRFR